MILEREQINRYLRQIIIPEISGPGQKKLLESSVFVWAENVNEAAPSIHYLAASGIGRISCQFANTIGFDNLSAVIHDLNSDVSIELSEARTGDSGIFFGKPDSIVKKHDLIFTDFIPSIICLYSGWRGGIGVYRNVDSLESIFAHLTDIKQTSGVESPDQGINGELFSTCFLGALSTLEVIKLLLGIGRQADDLLHFDLMLMEFSKDGREEIEATLLKINSQIHGDRIPNNLRNSKVLIVGTGGLGSPVAYALASAGVGTIGLVDYDTVEISNLNRQILHSTSRIGLPKVESAAVYLKNLNPCLNIHKYNISLSKENVFDIIKDYDVVIDALDNFPTRFLLNDACFFTQKPIIDAGVIRFDGTGTTILNQHRSPCYRCIYPNIPSPGSIQHALNRACLEQCLESWVLSSQQRP